jgi:hypothetical protein
MGLSKMEMVKLATTMDLGDTTLPQTAGAINEMFGTSFEEPTTLADWLEIGLKAQAILRVRMVQAIVEATENV